MWRVWRKLDAQRVVVGCLKVRDHLQDIVVVGWDDMRILSGWQGVDSKPLKSSNYCT